MIRIDKEDLKILWYEDENGNVIQGELATDGSFPADAKYQHSQFPFMVQHNIIDMETGNNIMTGESTYSADFVMALANSGDFTHDEAILIAVNSCEKCMNVLAYEYGLDWGYAEDSIEAEECGTVCQFCEDENVQFIGNVTAKNFNQTSVNEFLRDIARSKEFEQFSNMMAINFPDDIQVNGKNLQMIVTEVANDTIIKLAKYLAKNNKTQIIDLEKVFASVEKEITAMVNIKY